MHAKLLSGGQDGATHNRLGTAGLEGTGGTGRPGCSAGGRRQGLAGQRVDAPSEARSADGGRAAAHGHTKQPGSTRAHQAARPHNRVLHRPEHQRRHQHRPEHQRRNTPPRHSKAARPRRDRAAQPVSEDHRRITTISGLPRPLSWRTFEIPSFEAMSLAVPSIRGSS